mmetsp:Transcript_7541/g.31121  ORF Transcript_7541/g.31121 Transcript_7541/m.31121 type:complete len:215 (-) Transcript_7541:168-812(-)
MDPSPFQSRVVTSLLFLFLSSDSNPRSLSSSPSPSCAPSTGECTSTTGSFSDPCARRPDGPAGTDHTLAVASPDPLASCDVAGDHAQMNTSPSWPSRRVTSSSSIASAPTSASSASIGVAPPLAVSASSFSRLTRACSRSSSEPLFRFSLTMFLSSSTGLDRRSEEFSMLKFPSTSVPSSLRLASSSRYWSPFWMNEMSAPGGRSVPAMDVFWM